MGLVSYWILTISVITQGIYYTTQQLEHPQWLLSSPQLSLSLISISKHKKKNQLCQVSSWDIHLKPEENTTISSAWTFLSPYMQQCYYQYLRHTCFFSQRGSVSKITLFKNKGHFCSISLPKTSVRGMEVPCGNEGWSQSILKTSLAPA